MDKVKKLAIKSKDIITSEGGVVFAKRAIKYAYYRQFPDRKKQQLKDVLIINGCGLPHPARYRVDHQVEQLLAAGMTADSVFYDQLNLSQLKYYQSFIFFRCPITDTVKEFIKQAKYFNKTCFYDIDDLVIDTKYTDKIEYVSNMTKADKALYDDGVNRMRKTLELCEYSITTTEALRKELQHYTKEVYINRNTASDEMVLHSLNALKAVKKDSEKIILGYFSGSITHNEDFELITPALLKILEKFPNVYLKIAGILNIPKAFELYEDRILTTGFMDWKSLPFELASCDINLAPLAKSIFNEAKSENKWTEAALVKVPTLASNLGAFKTIIANNETGILVETPQEWEDALRELIESDKLRETIGSNAHKEVLEHHTTVGTAHALAKFIRSKLSPSIAFILPTTDISGGVNVVLKHADILRSNGWNVTLLDDIHRKALKSSTRSYEYRLDIPGYNVVTMFNVEVEAYFDTMVATLWTTLRHIKEYPNVKRKLYLVQSYETGFAPWGSGEGKFKANATYCDNTGLEYITISKWCQEWLKSIYGQDARYAPNGINGDLYPFNDRDFSKEKIKILIEGDSKTDYKNTDEAFRIVDKLDLNKYHISYLSYRKEPKDWYKVDTFYNRIDPLKVGEVYASCDILIKTSLLESFSYPPLEMMATGGFTVVVPNDGNKEYLIDGVNTLLYSAGDIDDGVRAVERIVGDPELRKKLAKNGVETARGYDWSGIEDKILALYQ